MITEGILVAIIGGCFSLLGVMITTYKCCAKSSKTEEKIKEYHGTPTQILNYQYGPGGGGIISENVRIENGKYMLELKPKEKMKGGNSHGEINVFRVFKQNNGGYHMEAYMSNVSGDVKMFVKRFNDKWDYIGNPAVYTVPVGNGLNILDAPSQIGMYGITQEQVGIMICSDHSGRNTWGKCNIDNVLLNHKFEYII